ncbi:MAG: hypothetical protein V7776_04950 [Halopseudomonas aestusnigri]
MSLENKIRDLAIDISTEINTVRSEVEALPATEILSLSQAAYDALSPPVATTLYLIIP